MRFSGTHHVGLPRQRLWEALSDPAVLGRALPGCRSLERAGADVYTAVLETQIGEVQGTYRGTLRLVERDAPRSCRLTVDGAGAPGTVQAEASVRLEEHDGGTTVHYEGDGAVEGLIGGVGQRVLVGLARRNVGELLAGIERVVAEAVADAQEPAPAAAAPAGEPEPAPAPAEPAEIDHAPFDSRTRRRGRALAGLVAAVAGAALALAGVLLGRRVGRRR